MGSYEEALKCFNQALRIDPRFQIALKNLSICMERLSWPRKNIEYHPAAVFNSLNPARKARNLKAGETGPARGGAGKKLPEKPQTNHPDNQGDATLSLEQIFIQDHERNQADKGNMDSMFNIQNPGEKGRDNSEPNSDQENSKNIAQNPLLFEKVDGGSVDMDTLPRGSYQLQDQYGKIIRRNWDPENTGLAKVWKGFARARWKLKEITDHSTTDDFTDKNTDNSTGQPKLYSHRISEGWLEKYETDPDRNFRGNKQ